MGRYRRNGFDGVRVVLGLAFSLAAFSFIHLPLRQMLIQWGVLAVSFAVALLVLTPFLIFALRPKRGNRDGALSQRHDLDVLTTEPLSFFARQAVPAPPTPTTLPSLIERLRTIDWFQFEKVVAATYRKLGYSVMRRGGANPDGGIDLIIDKNGEQMAVQCKHWKTRDVGVRPVREFLGGLTDAGLSKGIFITLSGYTGDAKQLADRHGIEILNATGLAKLLKSADASYDPELLAILNDTTKYCPKCESTMVLRTALNGPSPGSQFWGCSKYPHCRSTLPMS